MVFGLNAPNRSAPILRPQLSNQLRGRRQPLLVIKSSRLAVVDPIRLARTQTLYLDQIVTRLRHPSSIA